MTRSRGAVLALAIMMLFACAAMTQKGLWYDEAWTLFMARHDMPLSGMYSDRWIYDAHPPLFYFLSWAFQPLTGTNVVYGRLFNLAYLLLAAVSELCRQRPAAKPAFLIGAVLALGNPLSLYALIDYRSYFLLLCAWFVGVASIYAAVIGGRDVERRDWPVALIGACSIIISLNLHYIATLLIGVMLGIFTLQLILKRCWGWARIYVAAGLVGSILFATNALAQLPHLKAVSSLEWGTSPFAATKIVTSVLALSLCANLTAFGAAIAARSTLRHMPFAKACVAALAVAVATAFVLNEVHGVLLRRYLTAVVPVASLLIAVLAAERLGSRAFVLVLANGVAVSAAYLLVARTEDWTELGSSIGKIAAACPSTQVLGVQNWRMADQRPYPLADQSKVFALGYGIVGDEFGFKPSMRDPDAAAISPGECPVIVWAEHYRFKVPSASQLASRGGVKGKLARVHRTDTGFMAVFTRN